MSDSKTHPFRYRRRYVAFIDVLGLANHLSGVRGANFAKNIVTIISETLSKEGKLFSNLRHIKSGRVVRATFPGWADNVDDVNCRISSISDSIVISVPENVVRGGKKYSRIFGMLICFEMVFWLQRELIRCGILTRGAISFGRLHHGDSIVIGEGLVTAYRLENQSAIYPRVVLAPVIQELMLAEPTKVSGFLFRERIATLFTQDHDGTYFIDYLGKDLMASELDWSRRLRKIDLFVRDELSEIQNLRIKQKFSWLLSYVQRAKRIASSKKLAAHMTTGNLEKAFPRKIPSKKEFRRMLG
jgi:hypothetical protein